MIKKAYQYYKKNGLYMFLLRCGSELTHRRGMRDYDSFARSMAPTNEELSMQRKFPFVDRPLISIVVPTYNTPPQYLRELIDSVMEQSYSNWELILADGCSKKPETREELHREASRDARIKVLFLKENGGISVNTNAALAAAEGEYIVFSDHDDILTPDALFELIRTFQDTAADFIYSDEDKIDENSCRYHSPHFKPDYSFFYLLCTNYMCHIVAVKKDAIIKVGGLDPQYDGSQDHDFNLRCAEHGLKIVHIPKVLYHWRSFSRSISNTNHEKCANAACALVQAYLKRCACTAVVERQEIGNRVRFIAASQPLVSIVYTGNSQALQAVTLYKNLQICSSVSEARGEYIAFLSADVWPIDSEWLTHLLGCAQQAGVSGVSGRLESKYGRISYVGAVFIDGKLAYPYYNCFTFEMGYMLRNLCMREVSALCPDFCLVRADLLRGFLAGSSCEAQDIVRFSLANLGSCIYLPYVCARRAGKNPDIPAECNGVYSLPCEEDPYYNPNLSTNANFYALNKKLTLNRKVNSTKCLSK